MRTKILAGNWKMNKTPAEASVFVAALAPLVKDAAAEVVLCAPAIDLPALESATKGTNITFGAQNMHWAESGAYTGELSAAMLSAIGTSYVVLGHSERRQYFGETDETVNLRTLAAVKAGITPIVCVGELLAQREAGYTDELVAYQTRIALTGLSAEQVAKLVIAYEPVWAIGTGKTATAEEAQRVCKLIRTAVAASYGSDAANGVRIQYGGSMNEKNAAELKAMPDIDGGLIGSASLKPEIFAQIIHA